MLVALFYCFPGILCLLGVMWLIITVQWVGLQCVIVVFPDLTIICPMLVISTKEIINV